MSSIYSKGMDWFNVGFHLSNYYEEYDLHPCFKRLASAPPGPKMSEILKTRDTWFARHSGFVPQLPTPVNNLFIHYTRKEYTGRTSKRSPGPRPTTAQVIEELMYLQRGDMRNAPDIRYNFMIGPDCNTYEGRGWTAVSALPVKWNTLSFKCFYIALIGDFTNEEPPPCMFDKLQELIRYGVRNCLINPTLTVYQLGVPTKYKLSFDKYIKLDL